MANNDVYQVVDKQLFAGQEVLNVYFFKMTDAPAGYTDASAVTAGFIANLLPTILTCQTADVLHTSIKARNLYNVSDAHEELVSEIGEDEAGYQNVFDAYGIRLVGDNAAVRGGSKRYAGVQDDAVEDGVVISLAIQGFLSDLATALATGVPFGLLDAGTLVPVIVKRLLIGGNYELPTNSGDAILSVIVDSLVDALVTSQVSRKVGRGA